MRVKRGDEVVLFDGSGAEFLAQVEKIGRSELGLSILGREEIDRELPLAVTLGRHCPRGSGKSGSSKRRWNSASPGWCRLEPPGRWPSRRRKPSTACGAGVIEASKQCGRNRLMDIAEPLEWQALVTETGGEPCRLLAHPGGALPGGHQQENGLMGCHAHACRGHEESQDLPQHAHDKRGHGTLLSPSGRVFLAVGPEGGFTDDEVSLALSAGSAPWASAPASSA